MQKRDQKNVISVCIMALFDPLIYLYKNVNAKTMFHFSILKMERKEKNINIQALRI